MKVCLTVSVPFKIFFSRTDVENSSRFQVYCVFRNLVSCHFITQFLLYMRNGCTGVSVWFFERLSTAEEVCLCSQSKRSNSQEHEGNDISVKSHSHFIFRLFCIFLLRDASGYSIWVLNSVSYKVKNLSYVSKRKKEKISSICLSKAVFVKSAN